MGSFEGGALSEWVDEFDAVVALAVVEVFAIDGGGAEASGGSQDEGIPIADFVPVCRQICLGDREYIDLEARELHQFFDEHNGGGGGERFLFSQVEEIGRAHV